MVNGKCAAFIQRCSNRVRRLVQGHLHTQEKPAIELATFWLPAEPHTNLLLLSLFTNGPTDLRQLELK